MQESCVSSPSPVFCSQFHFVSKQQRENKIYFDKIDQQIFNLSKILHKLYLICIRLDLWKQLEMMFEMKVAPNNMFSDLSSMTSSNECFCAFRISLGSKDARTELDGNMTDRPGTIIYREVGHYRPMHYRSAYLSSS